MEETFIFSPIIVLPFILFYVLMFLGVIDSFIERLSGEHPFFSNIPNGRDLILISLVLDVVVIFEKYALSFESFNRVEFIRSEFTLPFLLFSAHFFMYIAVQVLKHKNYSLNYVNLHSLVFGLSALFTNAWTLDMYLFQY